LRLVAFAGMGAGIWFCFVDIRGEYRCDKTMEVWDSEQKPGDACLLTTAPMSKNALNTRAKKFAEERLRIVTAANQKKLKVELEHQVMQMDIEKQHMGNMLEEFTEECKVDTVSFVMSRWDHENRNYMHGVDMLHRNFDNVSAQVLMLSPLLNATDICHTANYTKGNSLNQCATDNITDDQVKSRTWVVSGVNGCSMEHSKLLFSNLGSMTSFQKRFDMCSKVAERDIQCGNEIFAGDGKCWCIKRLYTCHENQNMSFMGEVFENKAVLTYKSGGACMYTGGYYSGRGVIAESAGDNFNLACQFACVQSAGCAKWQRNPVSNKCFLVYAPGSASAPYSTMPSVWIIGDPMCGLCQDDAGDFESVCRAKGVTVDLRCSWKLHCSDRETLDYCGVYYPEMCKQVTKTTTMTTTTTTKHDFCRFEGDVTFNIRLDSAYVEHDGSGSLAGVQDNRFGPEFGTMQGTEVSTYVFGVHKDLGGKQSEAALMNWHTGKVIASAKGVTGLAVDCNKLGGCGYVGKARFVCDGRRIEYDLSECRTTASERWACYQKRNSNITKQKKDALENITTHWQMQNESFEDHLNESSYVIEDDIEMARKSMFRIDFTKNALADLSKQIAEFELGEMEHIAEEFDGEYRVDVGERYRIGCAHRDSSFNWGMGPDVQPTNHSFKTYIKQSGDLSGDFLLHACTSLDVTLERCSHNASLARLDMSKMWGAGDDPLMPPMKMPALLPKVLLERSSCLEMPCLSHPERQTCALKVIGSTVRLTSPSGLYVRSKTGATDVPRLVNILDPETAWTVEDAGGGSIRLVAGTGKALAMDSSGQLSVTTKDAKNTDQIWTMDDARDGTVYITSSHALYLAELSLGSPAPGPSGPVPTTTTTTHMADAHPFINCIVGMDTCLGTSEELGPNQTFRLLDAASGGEVCNLAHDSGDRVSGKGWTKKCDQGILALDNTFKWERYAYDHSSNKSSLVPMESSMSCTHAYDKMRAKWEAWRDEEGKKVLEGMEEKAYEAHYKIMQDTWKKWMTWEQGQSIYIPEKVQVSECVHNPAMTTEGRMVTSGWEAFGPRTEDCRLAKCEVSQCVVKKMKCMLGESTDEVTYECAEQIHFSKKAIDELLIGIFGFLLSFVVFVVSRCLDDPKSPKGPSARIVPEESLEHEGKEDSPGGASVRSGGKQREVRGLNILGPRGAGNVVADARNRKAPMTDNDEVMAIQEETYKEK